MVERVRNNSSQWHSRPIKSRKAYAIFCFFALLWIVQFSKGLLDSGLSASEFRYNLTLLLGWGCLLAIAVRRRLLYLAFSSWWTVPIIATSFGATALLTIFDRAPLWSLPLIYFAPQLALLIGKTEEIPKIEYPHPRVRYSLMVLAIIDLPMSYFMHTPKQFWADVSICGPVMVYLTAGRFRDIGFPRWSALPYTLIALSPYLQFYLRPGVDRWVLALAAILLQTPAMFLRKEWITATKKTLVNR